MPGNGSPARTVEHRRVGDPRPVPWREWIEEHIRLGGDVDHVEGQGHNQLAGAAAELLQRYDRIAKALEKAAGELDLAAERLDRHRRFGSVRANGAAWRAREALRVAQEEARSNG